MYGRWCKCMWITWADHLHLSSYLTTNHRHVSNCTKWEVCGRCGSQPRLAPRILIAPSPQCPLLRGLPRCEAYRPCKISVPSTVVSRIAVMIINWRGVWQPSFTQKYVKKKDKSAVLLPPFPRFPPSLHSLISSSTHFCGCLLHSFRFMQRMFTKLCSYCRVELDPIRVLHELKTLEHRYGSKSSFTSQT